MDSKETLIYQFRYEIFFFSLIFILFGSLFIPFHVYFIYVEPALFLINVLAGVQLLKPYPRIHKVGWIIFFLALFSTLFEQSFSETLGGEIATKVRLFMLFFFYAAVTLQLIYQVWATKEIKSRGLMALMSGYICLGLVGFFIFISIEFYAPGSLSNVQIEGNQKEDIMYFSFITLLTIGYGDISPLTPIARSASVFLGLAGQFYMVILVALVIDKFKSTIKGAKDVINS